MKFIDYSNDGNVQVTYNQQIKPLISVIIPVYNSELYLKECLDSVINQTYKKIEIICVDDGSTDHSLDILNFYQKKDSRIKVFTQENSGPSAARNKALDMAKGDYISFVDSDDFLKPYTYSTLIEYATQERSWDLIIFGGNIVGERNTYFEEKLSTEYREYLDCKPGTVVFGEKAARPFLWLHFFKRELLEKPEKIRFMEDINLGEDQIFEFEYIPRAKNVLVLDKKFYNYRIENNASLMQLYNNRRIKKTECHFTIIKTVIENWKKDGYYSLYQDDIWTWAVQLMYWTINDLPSEFRKEYSIQMLDLMKTYDVEEYLVSGSEVSHYKELKKWAESNTSSESDLNLIKKKIEQENFEIEETLKSKAFKLGKFFTGKKKRLDIDKIIEV